MVQAREYANFLRAAGADVTVWAETGPPPGRYDIAHLFNLDLPLETARQLRQARACAERVLLSTIHHRERWMAELHTRARSGAAGIVARAVPLHRFEALRGAWVARRRPAQLPEAMRQLLGGVRRRQRQILAGIDARLVLADGERRSLQADFGVRGEGLLVPNGAAVSDGDAPRGLPAEFLLCVARVEARKNPLTLIAAAERLDVPVVFVGSPNAHHRALTDRFRARVEESPHASWLAQLDRASLSAVYRAAACHVLPSWCEVVPLVDLEAAAAGTRVVTTSRGHTDEYLGDLARYWEPETGVDGLVEEISRSLCGPPPVAPDDRRWTWERAGQALVEAYEAAATLPPR
jgi:glycosyltransferase involved in cell wall biosynthesis